MHKVEMQMLQAEVAAKVDHTRCLMHVLLHRQRYVSVCGGAQQQVVQPFPHRLWCVCIPLNCCTVLTLVILLKA